MARSVTTRLVRGQVAAYEQGLAVMVGKWAIGATGAVGAKTGGIGLALTRSGVGSYTLQLTDQAGNAAGAPFILSVIPTVEEADTNPADDTDAYAARVLSITDSTGAILLQTHDEAFVARDPASGAFLRVVVHLKLSTVTR